MNKRSGFGVIEVLVVVAVVGILVAGVMVWWREQNEETSFKWKPDPRAGWMSYTSELDGVGFSYPVDWKLRNRSLSDGELAMESVEVVAPSGLTVRFSVSANTGRGGACPLESPGCWMHVYTDSPLFELHEGVTLHLLKYWRVEDEGPGKFYSMYVVDQHYAPESDLVSGVYYPFVTAKKVYEAMESQIDGVIEFGFTDRVAKVEMSADEFYNQAEVKQAELMLSSLHY